MNTRGFTLIESLVSIIILSICLAGGISLFTYADQITALSIHKKVANEMISSSLENLRDGSYDSIVTTGGTNTFITTRINVGGLDATESITVRCIDENTGPYLPPCNGNEDYKEVTLNVTWTEAAEIAPRDKYEAVTYIAP